MVLHVLVIRKSVSQVAHAVEFLTSEERIEQASCVRCLVPDCF